MAQRQRHVLNGIQRDIGLDRREIATVLAALRLLQSTVVLPARFNTILTDGDQLEPLTDDEIDDLCERINV